MPPKKASANDNTSATGGPFKWEGPNDLKLLLLTQGRWVKPDEYPQLSSAFPGTATGSIRNRISVLRVKQRDLYVELGWTLPEGAAGHSAKKASKNATPRKRAGEDDGSEVETPSKKSRKGRGVRNVLEEEVVEEGAEGDEDGGGVEEEEEGGYVPLRRKVKVEVGEDMV